MMNSTQVLRSYALWAPLYDKVFGRLFAGPRRAAIDAAERVGGRVLEVGVGTGLSLGLYSRRVRITGIDISRPMLDQARARVAAEGLRHVETLLEMDAAHLAFPDNHFDVVMLQYVVNTVPDPEATLAEAARVLRPGGEIVIVNRIGAEGGPRRAVERALMPVTERLGWRAEFPWDRFERWRAATPGLRLVERRPMPPFGHFALIRFAKAPV